MLTQETTKFQTLALTLTLLHLFQTLIWSNKFMEDGESTEFPSQMLIKQRIKLKIQSHQFLLFKRNYKNKKTELSRELQKLRVFQLLRTLLRLLMLEFNLHQLVLQILLMLLINKRSTLLILTTQLTEEWPLSKKEKAKRVYQQKKKQIEKQRMMQLMMRIKYLLLKLKNKLLKEKLLKKLRRQKRKLLLRQLKQRVIKKNQLKK